ncbi:MAG: HAD family hydrolase [Pseudomonadota bacterium]
MQLTRPQAVIFDWDNTLVDSWGTIHAALVETFVAMGHQPWTLAEVKQKVARSMRDSFPIIFGERWKEAAQIYQDSFLAVHLQNLQAFKYAESTLKLLQKEAIFTAIASNKKGDTLRKEVAHLEWTDYFHAIIGAGDTALDKPAADPALEAMKYSGISVGKNVWFIGDSEVDMQCATAAGCLPIWYGESKNKPPQYDIEHTVSDHSELLKLLKGL